MTLKEIAIELLEKYEASETSVIWEYSGNIRSSEDILKKEIKKYRKMIDEADRKDEPQTMVYPQVDGITPSVIVKDEPKTRYKVTIPYGDDVPLKKIIELELKDEPQTERSE